ncbi:hypothetical protein P3S67_018086 [Capsicum chacoense]
MDDFNTLLTEDNRTSSVQEIEVKDFNNFLENTGSSKIKTIGRKYTWTNGHVYSKIDWALGSTRWRQRFPHVVAKVLHPGFSDHTPLAITIQSSTPCKAKPFRFINALAKLVDFLKVVKTGWKVHVQGNYMDHIWNKLKNVKKELKKLNTQDFINVGNKIKAARARLQEI